MYVPLASSSSTANNIAGNGATPYSNTGGRCSGRVDFSKKKINKPQRLNRSTNLSGGRSGEGPCTSLSLASSSTAKQPITGNGATPYSNTGGRCSGRVDFSKKKINKPQRLNRSTNLSGGRSGEAVYVPLASSSSTANNIAGNGATPYSNTGGRCSGRVDFSKKKINKPQRRPAKAVYVP